MFTGIIEEVGRISRLTVRQDGAEIAVRCRLVCDGLQPGDSVCTSGVCLTATRVNSDGFQADLSGETLSRSTLRELKVESPVNLERAMTAGGRLGGHIVQGHVDGVGEVLSRPSGSATGEWRFSLPEELAKYVVEKGSIAIDGISLTVSGIEGRTFGVAIIPATISSTTLHERKPGDRINLEVDILAKYVERLLDARLSGKNKQNLVDTLRQYDYIG